MRQTPQQIRVGGYASLGIGILNLLIFSIFALARHNGSYFMGALPATLVVGFLGAAYVTQAERIADSPVTQKVPKKVREEAANRGVTPQSLRTAGTILAATGAGLFVLLLLVALVTHLWSLIFTTVAPAIILLTMGLLFIATDRPTAH
jgi:hypothetical protein